METMKRPRGRPRKYPLSNNVTTTSQNTSVTFLSEIPEPVNGDLPVILSIGIEKKKGLYSTFLLKTRGDRVIEKTYKQEDIKEASLNMLYIEMLEQFVDPNF